jgi:hypothetical protein
MKKYSLLLLISAIAISVQAQFNSEKDPFLTKTFSADAVKNVKAQTSGGSITVEGGAGNTRIEVFVRPGNMRNGDNVSKEELQKRLDDDYELTVSVDGSTLNAIAKQKNRNIDWKRSVSISYKIYVQQNVSTDLATSGGSIKLKNLTGKQDFSTSGGSLTVEKMSGNVVGRTSGGSITLSECKDNVDLATSGGSINASKCTGKIKLATSGGSLTLEDLNGTIDATTSGGSVHGHDISGDLDAHTSGGSISLQRLSCSLETSTSGGHISVEIIELKDYVRINNSSGNVNLTIPNKGVDLKLSANKISTEKLNNFTGSVEDDNINGKLNGGGTKVSVDAGSGKITLTLK